jgi:hypothetical protein
MAITASRAGTEPAAGWERAMASAVSRAAAAVGELRADLVERDQPGEVPGRQVHQLAAVGGPQRGGRVPLVGLSWPRHRLRVGRHGPGGRQQGGAQLRRRRSA